MKLIILATVTSFFSLAANAGPCEDLVTKASGEYNANNFSASFKTAEAAIAACKAQNVRSAPAHVLAGASLLRQEKYQMAAKEFKLAEAIDPKSEIIQKNLCSVYGLLKDDVQSDKYCGINQPQPVAAPAKNCHFPNELEDLKRKWSEAFENCKNKPALSLGFVTPVCAYNSGGKGGQGGIAYMTVERLLDLINDACAEKPTALARVKTITVKEASRFEGQVVKDLQTSLEAAVLVGRWNETVSITKAEETTDKLKADLRKILGVKLQNEIEKNNEENANLNKGYSDYNAKMNAARAKQTALMNQRNKISMELGTGIGKIWSAPGDPAKKGAQAEAFQKKSDAEMAALDKQIEAATKEMEKLTADYEKTQK